jgi:uncharacterized protein with von Willebrand factor type A (vWA) domain
MARGAHDGLNDSRLSGNDTATGQRREYAAGRTLTLALRKTANSALRDQVAKIDAGILALDTEIAQAEADMNALVYRLYELTDDEIKLVEAG